jgi:glycosyltransferase involved in cell wall biosynthesis
MNKPKILFSIPTRHHIEIALDEMTGMQEYGYICERFPYAAKEGVVSKAGRMRVIIQNALNLIKIARRFKPDIIYFNSRLEEIGCTRDFITLVLFKSLYHKKVRFMLKSHGSEPNILESKKFLMSRVVLPFLKKNVNGWLFLSTEEKEKIIQTGYFPADRIFVTKNIVRTYQFKPNPGFRPRLNIPEDNKILLFVGRIIRVKGIHDVIDAFANIKIDHKTTLIIVGDGSEYQNIKQRISTLNLTDSVILTGFIPEAEVVEFHANSDVLVYPTYDQEGFPMALFNSVAAGMCVITTRLRAATDYLSEPENCMWVEPQNSNSVYNAINKLFQSDGLMHQMRKNNIEKAKLFGKEQVCADLSKIIDTLTIQSWS